MNFLTVALLLLAVMSAAAVTDISENIEQKEEFPISNVKDDQSHRQIKKLEENEPATLDDTVTNKLAEELANENHDEEKLDETDTENDDIKDNESIANSDDENDTAKVFHLSNHQLHDLHWELFSNKETTTTTRHPTRWPTYHPTKYPTTQRPSDPYPPYPPYPPFPPHHRPPYPPRWPYYGAPPPYAFPPFGYPPIPPPPWWLRPTRRPIATPAPTTTPITPATNNRRKPTRKRRPTAAPYRDTAYKDYIQSLKPMISGQTAPIYIAVSDSQQPLNSTTNFLFNPASNQLTPVAVTSKPLYFQTSVSTSPDSNVLSLSTSLSSSTHHSSVSNNPNMALITKPSVVGSSSSSPQNQLTRIEMPIAEADELNSIVGEAPTSEPSPAPLPTTGNETFCAVFGWICDSNSKVKVAQFENPEATNKPYVLLVVQPPIPTQVTFMKSAK